MATGKAPDNPRHVAAAVCCAAILGLSSAMALEVRLSPSGLRFPELGIPLEMLTPRQHSWISGEICPAPDGFDTMKDGELPYNLCENTGHSWMCPMGEGRLSAHPSNGILHVTNTVTFTADAPLASTMFRIRLPRAEIDGGRWKLDKRSGTWDGMKKPVCEKSATLSFDMPKAGRTLTFAFQRPIDVRIQDDLLNKMDSVSLWFGDSSARVRSTGETWRCEFALAANDPVTFSAAKKLTVGVGSGWTPLEYRKDIVAGSALDLSGQGMIDAPAGKHGWLKGRDGHFFFERRPDVPQRFYGVNMCSRASVPPKDIADMAVTRLVRLGYNAIREHLQDTPFAWRAKPGATFDPVMMDRFDYFMARAFKAGIYVTTDLYSSRDVAWRDLGEEKDGIVPVQALKGLFMLTERGFANWAAFSRDFLEHVNPYTGRAYKDEPGMPFYSLINENPLSMGWHELRTYPVIQDLWKKRFGTDDCARVEENDSRLALFSAEAEERFCTKAKALFAEIGAKALVTDLTCGGTDPAGRAVRNRLFDYADIHLYVDHPKFPVARWKMPAFVGTRNPLRNPNLRPLTIRDSLEAPSLPFVSSEWSFVGPGRFRGVGGIVTGAAAARDDWAGAWRYTYALMHETIPGGRGFVGWFDLTGDPLQQAADRAVLCLFLRGDLAVGSKGLRIDSRSGTLAIDTPRTCGGFAESGTISAGALSADIGGVPTTMWVSSVDGNDIAHSRRLVLTHLTDVQAAGTTFGDETRSLLLAWGRTTPMVLNGTAAVSIAMAHPGRYDVFALATDGTRLDAVPASHAKGKLTFRVSVKGPDGKARMLYEIAERRETGKISQPGPVPLQAVKGIYRDDADYLLRKFREDVTDPATGLDNAALKKGAAAIYERENPPIDSWRMTKAHILRYFCEKMAIGASWHDWFPAIACWNRWDRPLSGLIGKKRNEPVDARYCPDATARAMAGNETGRWTMWKDFDHSVPEWHVILKLGFPGMKRRLKEHWRDTEYYAAGEVVMDAVLHLVGRFEECARKELARTENAHGRERLEKEIASLGRLRNGPPESAYDAMLFTWIYFFVSEHLGHMQVRSLSNLDVTLAPFYRADIAAGRTTEAEFREQLKHFWWQWGSVDNYWCQPVSIGGTGPDGGTLFSDFTKIVLDVHDECALPTPKLLVKTSASTPKWAWDKMLDMHRRHRSLVYIGETGIARAFKSLGYTDEDARTAELRGCYEAVPLKGMNRTSTGHINLLKPVETLLRQASDGTFSAATWDEFLAAYRRSLAQTSTECREIASEWDRHLEKVNPAILFSLATTHSVETGLDAFANGTEKGNNTGILMVGLGTTVDALLAVKEIVYEQKLHTLAELGSIMAVNWKGHDELRMRMRNSKRKWGNNNPEANALADVVVRTYAEPINGKPNTRNGRFITNGHCARQFIVQGRKLGATPDGRMAGDEMSKNISPAPGADTEGATALVMSTTSLDNRLLPGDFPLDVTMHPATVQGAAGLAAMRALVNVYQARGGMQIHFNIIDPEELRAAQRNPELYENLQIRVCGWNARWNDLDKREQDEYIRRAETVMR